MSDIIFETFTEEHRVPVVDIFNHYIEHSFAAYPEKRMDYSFYDMFLSIAANYPSAVIREDGNVTGFGMLRPYSPFGAFRHTAEISYFIHPGFTGKGKGKLLLDHLCGKGKDMGIGTIVAGISSRNGNSLVFHEKNGFAHAGRLHGVGRKFGEDFDVVLMQKFI